jgi:hypothetical protein
MSIEDLLEAVRNDRVEFVTTRPPGSRFALLGRRVVVTGPEELVELSRTGDPRVLEELVELLKEPDRAWAAEVLLAALTRREEEIVNSFAATPDEWWPAVGGTAHERWAEWLSGARGRLSWDAEEGNFVETA